MRARRLAWLGLGALLAFGLVLGGLDPLEEQQAVFPPLGLIQGHPLKGGAWSLLLGDSVFLYCGERSGPCDENLTRAVQAEARAQGRLRGRPLAAITSVNQSPFQFEAEAYRCSRLAVPPSLVLIEFNPRHSYQRVGLAQLRRSLPAGGPAGSITWDEDPLDDEPLRLSRTDRAWVWAQGLVEGTGRYWSALFQPAKQGLYARLYGRGKRYEPAVLEAELRTGRRFKQLGAEVLYFAVPQDWARLSEALAPADLERLRSNLQAGIERLRAEGFKVVDLSSLIKAGFQPPPQETEHLDRAAREQFSRALCQALP